MKGPSKVTAPQGRSAAKYVVGKLVKPNSWTDYLALIIGTPSVLQILQLVFQFRFAAILESAMDLYNKILSLAAFPIEQAVRSLLTAIGIQITIPDYWRHIFVLVALYTFRHAANIAQQARRADDADFAAELRRTLVLQIVSGLLLALSVVLILPASIGPTPTPQGQFVFIVSLSAAVLTYDLIYVVWHAYMLLPHYNRQYFRSQTSSEFIKERMIDAIIRNVLAAIVGSLVCLYLQKIGVPRAFLFAGIVTLATTGLYWARKASGILSRSPKFMTSESEIDSIRLAAAILRPIAYGLLFALANISAA